MRPTAHIFSMLQYVVVPYINHAPGVQIGHALGVIYSHRLIMGKETREIFFSETFRPTAYVFSM